MSKLIASQHAYEIFSWKPALIGKKIICLINIILR